MYFPLNQLVSTQQSLCQFLTVLNALNIHIKKLFHSYFLNCSVWCFCVAVWPSLPPPGGAAGMCCQSSAPPQVLLTPAAAPEADPDCLHLPHLLWTGISSEEPSPALSSTKHAEIAGVVGKAVFIYDKTHTHTSMYTHIHTHTHIWDIFF